MEEAEKIEYDSECSLKKTIEKTLEIIKRNDPDQTGRELDLDEIHSYTWRNGVVGNFRLVTNLAIVCDQIIRGKRILEIGLDMLCHKSLRSPSYKDDWGEFYDLLFQYNSHVHSDLDSVNRLQEDFGVKSKKVHPQSHHLKYDEELLKELEDTFNEKILDNKPMTEEEKKEWVQSNVTVMYFSPAQPAPHWIHEGTFLHFDGKVKKAVVKHLSRVLDNLVNHDLRLIAEYSAQLSSLRKEYGLESEQLNLDP